MKQKDIALIMVIVFISGIFGYFISNALIRTPKDRKQKVEVVESITSEFNPPSEKFFNSKTSINPTERIKIGEKNNSKPFE
jgi:hypothetical protein